MTRKSKPTAALAELRHRAVARLKKQPGRPRSAGAPAPPLPATSQRLLHELQVHQLELELQNAELQEARDRTESLLEKYTDLYDFAPVGYFALDDQGRIREVNLTGATLLGLERSRLINRPLQQFMVPTSRTGFLRFLERVFAGAGKQVFEVALQKEDGAAFWTELQAVWAVSLQSTRQRQWCRVAVSDITVRKQAEEVLLQNQAMFSTLIDHAPVGVSVVDGELRLLQVNSKARPAFSNIQPLFGRDVSEILRIQWPGKIAEDIISHYRHTLKTGTSYFAPDFSARRSDTRVTETYEWQLQRIMLPTGTYGVVCFFTDITERKRAEAAERRMEGLSLTNQKLRREIVRRLKVEQALTSSEQHQTQLLEASRHLQLQLRYLSHRILKAQEEERKRISRELHDEVTQSLVVINVHLASLVREGTVNPGRLKQQVARTQRLVEKTVTIVHEFARELRPTALDDLGLVATLHSFMKDFTKRTGIRGHFKTFTSGWIKGLDGTLRTVFYRVAQEALTNVARHAQATRVELSLQKRPGTLIMQVQDNGKAFEVERTLNPKNNRRLGLVGMRERVEMVGGRFAVESSPGQGTTIRAQVPLGAARRRGGGAGSPRRRRLE